MKYSWLIFLITINFVALAQHTHVDEKDITMDQIPQFKGGDNAFFEYLEREVKLPENFDGELYLKKNGNQYVSVTVYFTVGVDGSIKDVNVPDYVDKQLDEKAISIVKNMPKWEPGIHNGKLTEVQYAIPIRVSLK